MARPRRRLFFFLFLFPDLVLLIHDLKRMMDAFVIHSIDCLPWGSCTYFLFLLYPYFTFGGCSNNVTSAGGSAVSIFLFSFFLFDRFLTVLFDRCIFSFLTTDLSWFRFWNFCARLHLMYSLTHVLDVRMHQLGGGGAPGISKTKWPIFFLYDLTFLDM